MIESRGRSHMKDDFKSFPNRPYFLRIDWVSAEIRDFKGDAALLVKVPLSGVKNREPIGCNLGMVDLVEGRANAV